MQSGTDAHAEVPATGGRDIWKHSFHCGENMATRLGHREELTLKGLLRDRHALVVEAALPTRLSNWCGEARAPLARQDRLAGGTNTSHVSGQHEFRVALPVLGDTGAGKREKRCKQVWEVSLWPL